MKASTAIGIGLALGAIAVGATMEGTKLAALLNIPALLIVLGGTLGACIASCGLDALMRVPNLYIRAMNPPEQDPRQRVDQLVACAEKARREGLLALEQELAGIDDEFTRKGMQLVVDGTDPELVNDVLAAEIDGMEARHAEGSSPFEKAGGFAPTMGVLGTVMGLVHVLENLDKPETLGPAISGAFIATLFGVGAANVIFLPVCYRLKQLSREEVNHRWMTVEGILAIQAGDNPRIVREKLLAFIAPDKRGDAETGGDDRAPATEKRAA